MSAEQQAALFGQAEQGRRFEDVEWAIRWVRAAPGVRVGVMDACIDEEHARDVAKTLGELGQSVEVLSRSRVTYLSAWSASTTTSTTSTRRKRR